MNKQTDWLSVLVLTAAAIVFVTAELLPAGILPAISATFHQPIGRVGLMVTTYAWTVALSAFIITSWLARVERRKLLLCITVLFAGSNVLIACAPSLSVLFVGRIIGAFGHGVFWSIVGPLCVQFSGSGSKTRTTAFVFGGIAVATVIAVPAGTLLTQTMGWRMTFVCMAVISLMIAIMVGVRFPKLPGTGRGYIGQFRALLGNPVLRRVFPATAFASTGHFCAFTYISVLLGQRAGVSYRYLAWYLILFGGAGVLGNILIRRLTDQRLRQACQWAMTAMAVVIMSFAFVLIGSDWIAAFLVIIWGASVCVLITVLQSLILTLPQNLVDAASAMNVVMFNVGVGSGAFLGGLCADYLPIQAVAWVGGGVFLIAATLISWPIKKIHSVPSIV